MWVEQSAIHYETGALTHAIQSPCYIKVLNKWLIKLACESQLTEILFKLIIIIIIIIIILLRLNFWLLLLLEL